MEGEGNTGKKFPSGFPGRIPQVDGDLDEKKKTNRCMPGRYEELSVLCSLQI